ncbi:MAG: chromosome partitioning protein ParA [Gammaproteobacteria bacterium]|nr:chromosome partitioning protein ParA [Gammaproteobacteria bacterium]MBK82305.1 chromosome partitioning protein ParA [Gammaproteobacteria bacterium]MBK83783.1 chromosome partitioning protein ParA [Gammaproteobacteria bacterium]HCV03276.1 chromosome partitioning protein ParA [Pseudoalteromonas sp.]|tara:strand:- start:26080 stop:26688 length:609 start_codon:yes stop_codon:yes gene_type:complete
MKVITTTGYKGGVGKSTSAIHIADCLSRIGNTLLIDYDPNRSACNWYERGGMENVYFQVADEKKALKLIEGRDFLVLDTPARPQSEHIRELAEDCDLLILPTAPDTISLEPMFELVQKVDHSKARVLITIVPPAPSKEGELVQLDMIDAGLPVFKNMVRRTVAYPKANTLGLTVNLLEDKRLQAFAEDYQLVTDEIRKILNV